MLVVVDDADLPLGRLRLRTSGSAGGHNGLKSIIQELGTVEFPRLRVGVGRQAGELKNHVLGRFSADEKAQIDAAVKRAADAAELFAKENILAAMNRFNAAPAGRRPGITPDNFLATQSVTSRERVGVGESRRRQQ